MTLATAAASAADISEANGAHEEVMRIGEMARAFGVTLRTLRFYEGKGLLNPRREGSARLYSHRDRTRLKLVLLGRKVGFSLCEVKQMMDLYDPTGRDTRQFRLALEKSEKQLARLREQRTLIDDAIGELQDAMASVRERLAEAGGASSAAG